MNGKRHSASLLVGGERLVTDWPAASIGELSADHLAAIVGIKPEIVLLGTGKAFQFAEPRLLAPLYNAGNHEACYRIYEGTSIRFERESECKGVREAFGAGLLRSSTLESFTEKAWAMRDTFDGLIDAALAWQAANGKAPTTTPGRARPTSK